MKGISAQSTRYPWPMKVEGTIEHFTFSSSICKEANNGRGAPVATVQITNR